MVAQPIAYQVELDKATIALLDEMSDTYHFVCSAKELHDMSDIRKTKLMNLTRLTASCANFIREQYAEKSFCEPLYIS